MHSCIKHRPHTPHSMSMDSELTSTGECVVHTYIPAEGYALVSTYQCTVIHQFVPTCAVEICLQCVRMCSYMLLLPSIIVCRFQDGYFKTGDIAERRGESIVLIDRWVSNLAAHTDGY